MTDAVLILTRLFRGGEPLECEDAADDDDGTINLTDPVALLGHLFGAERPPPDPGSTCGRDPTPDALASCSGSCS